MKFKKVALGVGIVAIATLIARVLTIAYGSLYNLEDPEFLMDVGAFNPLNEDNKIFKASRTFIYKITITDKKGAEQKLAITRSIGGPDAILVTASAEHGLDYVVDHVSLNVNENKGLTSLGDSQTIIKYDYLERGNKVYYGEKTGVIEDSSRIFLHPPRTHVFYSNQLNPFPIVRFPILEHTFWEIDFPLPDHVFKKYSHLKDPTLKLFYSLVTTQTMETPFGIDSVYKFEAIGKNSDLETSTTYFFNPYHGFIRMEFVDLNRNLLVMELENIVDKNE